MNISAELLQLSDPLNLDRLILAGADIEGRVDTLTALGTAWKYKLPRHANILIYRGADIMAAHESLLDSVKNRRAEILSYQPYLDIPAQQIVANMHFSDNRQFAEVSWFIKQGVDLGFVVANKLIDAGVSVNHKDQWGETMIGHALRSGRKDMVKLLLERGADPNKTDSRGSGALIKACRWNSDPSVIKMLLAAGADINQKDEENQNGFHVAANRGASVTYIKILIDAGIDTNAVNKYGKTGFDLMLDKSPEDIRDLKLYVQSRYTRIAAGTMGQDSLCEGFDPYR